MKTLYGNNFKFHIVVSEKIVPFVSKDLETRFGEVFINSGSPPLIEDGCLLWDTGGSIIGNDIKFSFKLSEDLSIICRSQHWNLFKKSILKMVNEKRNEYFKLHSSIYALVLDDQQTSNLLSQVIRNSSKLDQISEVTLSRIPGIQTNVF